MDMFLNAAAITLLPKITTPNCKPLKARAFCCLGKNGEGRSLSGGPSQTEWEQHTKDTETENKHDDIWRLFREAQRNILYLNKLRIMALEELDNMKGEKKILLDRIEQLELKNKANPGKGFNPKSDKLSVSWELLLRIDSMILTGVIGTGEASDLRRLVMDSKVSVVDDFSDILPKSDSDLLAELRKFSENCKQKAFHVVHICTEMAPVVSVGSLASYVTGLSRALQRKGNLVEVILPKYASLNLGEVQALREIKAEFFSFFNGQLHANRVWTGVVYGIGVTFIQPIYYSSFFSHERIYGNSNDFERFIYFSRASLDYIVKSGKQPDVLHIHNWETAIVGPLFWDLFVKQGLESTRILLTCHGFNSQCLEQPEKLALCGLDPARLYRPDRLQDNSKPHLINILKGGIVYSNKVVIMSSTHSRGQIVRGLNRGLEPTLALYKDKLLIAPCGFDNSVWDPSIDKFLPESYSADDMKGKAMCKVALQQHLALSEDASLILVGCIYSEVTDVDLEILRTVAWIASKRGVQFVFMGVSKVPGINRALEAFQEEIQDGNVRFLNKYDEALSHLIFAGSDIIFCQQFDDPVLQVPLKALRYGAAPVAATLLDNQFRHSIDNDFESTRFSQFIKKTFGNASLSQAIDEIKKSHPSQWNRKIADAMREDFSWDGDCCDIHVSAYASITNI